MSRPPEELVSTRNNWFQKVETVTRNRKKRWAHRVFLVEGVRSLNALLAHPEWEVEALLYADGEALSKWADDMLDHLPARYHLKFAPELMAEVSDREDTSELMALVRIPPIDDQRLEIGPNGLVVVLDRPGNPGNLGSVIRSVDAFGAAGIVITGHAVDPFDPVTIRATAGSFFNVPISRVQGRAEFAGWLESERGAGLQVLGTSARGTKSLFECDLTGRTLLVMGNETDGISAWLREQCDVLARFDMQGEASSLNLACATTAILSEAARQRSRHEPRDEPPVSGSSFIR